MHYLSYAPQKYKINSISTLINRAYNICTTWSLFDLEMKFLSNYFETNGYPSIMFQKTLRLFLNDKFCQPLKLISVPKQTKYIKLPYLGRLSYSVRKQLRDVLKYSFPQVKFNIVFTNHYSINTYLKKRENFSSDLCSYVVYMFKCPSCNTRYIGSTTRWFKHRICEHMGKSIRTGLPLSNPAFSAIRQQSHTQDHPYTHNDFKILSTSPNRLDLLISESLQIHKMKPELNNSQTATQLFTV